MILAIDPGTEKSAWVLIEEYKQRPVQFAKDENEKVLDVIKQERSGLAVVIERLSPYGKRIGHEVLKTAEWYGRFVEAAHPHPVHGIYRREVKRTLLGKDRATDADIIRALCLRFAEHDIKTGKGTKANPDWFYGFKQDIWQAYALGIAWLDMEGPQVIGG